MNKWIKNIVIIFLELAIFAGVFWFVMRQKGFDKFEEVLPKARQAITGQSNQSFPELLEPRVRTFEWKYKNVAYSLPVTLYGSVDAFYGAQPKEYSYIGSLPQNWEEKYYGQFLNVDKQDQTISDLANKIAELGKKHKLSDDQIVELVLAFVQAIPYDDAKAKNILSNTGDEKIAYPYETLFSNSGVCSDKSFLATALLRSLGYGTTIFTYQKENHMAIGIKCPQQYSTYGSGYCYAETTAVGNKIGILPKLDPINNVASSEIKTQSNDLTSSIDQSRPLSEYQMFLATNGKEYDGIVSTLKVKQQLADLQEQIQAMQQILLGQKSEIIAEQKKLETMRDEVVALADSGNYKKYNSMAEKYNSLLEANKKAVENFNKQVNLYNQKVSSYNALLKE
jgi:hypothetical protein